MIVRFEFIVCQLVALVRKGGQRTLAEDAALKRAVSVFAETGLTIEGRPPSDEQRRFIKHVLPGAVMEDLPKLEDVMRLFDMDLGTVFGFETDPTQTLRVFSTA